MEHQGTAGTTLEKATCTLQLVREDKHEEQEDLGYFRNICGTLCIWFTLQGFRSGGEAAGVGSVRRHQELFPM